MNMAVTFSDYRMEAYKISVWENPAEEKRPRLTSFLIAFAFHAALLLIGGLLFVKAPEYGIDVSQAGVDIYLVAAPVKETPVIEEPQSMLSQEKTKLVNAAEKSDHRGDGSSAVPGENTTTLSSAGSGYTEIKPGYLKNLPPSYPSEAVQKGQEGLVLLSVAIDRNGHPKSVELKKSSGFHLLDASAVKAVKKWKFSPAHMGALTVDTEVTIPVRFRLEDAKKK